MRNNAEKIEIFITETFIICLIVSFLLNLVTCSIYGYIWAYFMGGKVDEITGAKNTYTSIIYLVLALFGFNIIILALMQDTVNKAVDNQ